jgi:hypothetical protein
MTKNEKLEAGHRLRRLLGRKFEKGKQTFLARVGAFQTCDPGRNTIVLVEFSQTKHLSFSIARTASKCLADFPNLQQLFLPQTARPSPLTLHRPNVRYSISTETASGAK